MCINMVQLYKHDNIVLTISEHLSCLCKCLAKLKKQSKLSCGIFVKKYGSIDRILGILPNWLPKNELNIGLASDSHVVPAKLNSLKCAIVGPSLHYFSYNYLWYYRKDMGAHSTDSVNILPTNSKDNISLTVHHLAKNAKCEKGAQ